MPGYLTIYIALLLFFEVCFLLGSFVADAEGERKWCARMTLIMLVWPLLLVYYVLWVGPQVLFAKMDLKEFFEQLKSWKETSL